jgi:hypothetical protein
MVTQIPALDAPPICEKCGLEGRRKCGPGVAATLDADKVVRTIERYFFIADLLVSI